MRSVESKGSALASHLRELFCHGRLDVDINENGMRQAEALARALDELGILHQVDVVASSDLLRASRTADIIAAQCRRAPRRTTDPQLREIGYGELQGTQSDTEKCLGDPAR